MAAGGIFLVLILALSCYFSKPCNSTTDTLRQGQHLKDWDELVSSNDVFTLKFFSFGTSIRPYLGIFYKNYHIYHKSRSNLDGNHDDVVWVANRNNPIPDIYSKLMIDANGKLTISSSAGTVLDLFTPTPTITRNASATLLDSGNLVLQELYPDGSVKQDLWQSFDYPTDTLLPGMKLGVNLKTGHRWSLTSWRSEQLPADGSFTLTEDPNGTSQLVILRRGNIHWRSGLWQNGQFENTNLQSSGPDVHLYYISSESERSFTYLTKTYDSFPALRMYPDGHLWGSTLNFDVQCLDIDLPGPGCAEYDLEKLECRKGYSIYSKDDLLSYPPNFGFTYVDEYVYDESYNLSLYDCKRICWRNCSCTAYAYATKNKAGCKTYGQMISRQMISGEKRYDHTEYYGISNIGSYRYGPYEIERSWNEYKNRREKWIWLLIGVGSLAALLSCYLVYNKSHVRGKAKNILKLLLNKLRRFYNDLQTDNLNNELRYFTFQSILSATNNFSSTNKLGEGGFGAVYKGNLVDGQEVAVKRLSKGSAQGVKEFKNETELIVKLQHTNLVRLLGCCIEKQEKILVYEYMPNNSLDFFLFDPRKSGLLDWNNRFVIIDGIAQGLVYLHKFSRLRVIHRDLKASNILLDDYLKPKISDFGMAKLFGINESEANTSRVVGTRGYMPPEYMREGIVSTKTDVFSFGVLLLEIVSGKKNHGSYDVEHPLNLLGLAWELWIEGRGLELMDPILEDSCSPKEVITCIHVGLLCVQDQAMDRPTMSEVVSLLTNENMNLPDPKRPAFFIQRHDAEAARDDNIGNGSVNGKVKKTQKLLLHKLRRFYNNIQRDKKMNNELRYFTFQSILSATNKFSSTNKLGEGGFGAVYKGKLVDGQEVAVKRLSRSSAQGIQEFKNETELIVKLQHTNLVRLLGCCIEKQEKILVYEYMPNNSLDFFLFDPIKNGLLDWNNRFVIIDGIAQGLVHLHKFSRLRVIHRDLKASNILLDDYLKPKISDFGMAKLFGINESEANTSRVVGTRGYMPPEYMREGTFSTKTDVFSFGVLLLEIVSSKKNHGSYDEEHPLNLLGLAWELWNKGRGLELMDPILEDSCTPKEVMTCIHVGLLCVQDHAMDRPTMSEVVSMLTNENMNLPDPKQPAFFIERHDTVAARDDNLGNGSVNGQSISIVVAR